MRRHLWRTPRQTGRTPTVRTVGVIAGLIVVLVAACGSPDRDGAAVEGIVSNEGGIVVKPPDVLTGETEVIDGQDTAPIGKEPASGDEGPKPAPDVAFAWFDGSESSITALQGEPTVLNFWASSCAACIAEMPEFEQAYQDLKGRVAFVGMNTGDRREAADRLAAETGVTYPLAEDIDGQVFRGFGLFVMPTTVLLTEAGDVAFVWHGILTEDELRTAIDTHIAPGTYEDV